MNKEIKRPLFLAFASQKGGVGKSTLAEIIASILYAEKRISLCVVDCDDTQDSFLRLRDREKINFKEMISNNPEVIKIIESKVKQLPNEQPYPIIKFDYTKGIDVLINKIRELESLRGCQFDLVILDFPGSAQDAMLLDFTLKMDYVFSPIEEDPQSLTSSRSYADSILSFVKEVQERIEKSPLEEKEKLISNNNINLKNIFLVWNKIDKRIKPIVRSFFEDEFREMNLTVFDNMLYLTTRFSREISHYGFDDFCRSTYFPPVEHIRETMGINDVVDELMAKMSLPNRGRE